MTLRVLVPSAGTAPEKIHTEPDGLNPQRGILELSQGVYHLELRISLRGKQQKE